jgi:hypothetical protein
VIWLLISATGSVPEADYRGMSSLDKVLALSRPAEPEEDPVSALVLELSETLSELRVCLAKSDPDNDGDDDSTAKGDTDHDYFSKGGKKKSPGKASSSKSAGKDDGDDDETAAAVAKLVKKGVPEAKARAMVKQSAKKVKASVLAESACVILSRLVDGDPVIEPEPTYLGRVLALAATAAPVGPAVKPAASVAKASAPKAAVKPKLDAHQLHVAHVKHVAHVAHLHVEHLAHMAHLAHLAGR